MHAMPTPRLFIALLFVAIPSAAFAFRQPDDRSATIELASGAPVRPQVAVSYRAPADSAAWNTFLTRAGGHWQSMWDRDTGVPLRIWGSGIAAPKSMGSPAAAERAARAILAEHLALLAPGAAIEDFAVAGNVLSDGVRSVGFVQMKDGAPVAQGQVSFRFKKDRMIAIGSEAFPNLSLEIEAPRISGPQAAQAALQWTPGRFDRVNDPVVRAVVLADGGIVAAHVIPVIVWTSSPIGRWEVDIDAATGRPFARRQTLMFATGTLRYNVPERYPRSTRYDAPAPLTSVTVDGAALMTAEDGSLVWPAGTSTTARLQTSISGSLVNINNEAGLTASTTLSLTDGGSAVWNESTDEMRDAQVTAFIAARNARDRARIIAPQLPFLQTQLQVYVNIDDVCNAYSDGETINFFRSGMGCENTARLTDVVTHEYGHSIHFHAIIRGVGEFETALSEGGADYLAATRVNDSGMGRGFFFTNQPLRELDPVGSEATWPSSSRDPHEVGLTYAGSMWDVRKHFIEKYGMERGVEMTDLLWYGVFQRASSIPTSYVEVLVGNDDDGDLSNGTPDMCEITDIFRAHGLASAADSGLSIGSVSLSDWKVAIPVTEAGLCPGFEISSAKLAWSLRGQADSGESVDMTRNAGVFEGTIPPQADGQVLRYRVELDFANGDVLHFPDNPAESRVRDVHRRGHADLLHRLRGRSGRGGLVAPDAERPGQPGARRVGVGRAELRSLDG